MITVILKSLLELIMAAASWNLGEQGISHTLTFTVCTNDVLQYTADLKAQQIITCLIREDNTFWQGFLNPNFERVFFLSGCCVRCLVSWSLQKIHVPQKASCFLVWNCLPWHHQHLSQTGSHTVLQMIHTLSLSLCLSVCLFFIS